MANRVVDTIQQHSLLHEGTVDQGSYGMAPYAAYNGSTNYSHRPAEGLKGMSGFTAGGWFQMTSGDTLMGVWLSAANFCWRLFVNGSTPTFYVSGNGSSSINVASSAITAGVWYHVIGRYTPSSQIAIFLDGVKTINTTSVPASLFNAAANFVIGGNSSGGELLTGKASLCFLCHEPLADEQITVLYQMSRHLYDR